MSGGRGSNQYQTTPGGVPISSRSATSETLEAVRSSPVVAVVHEQSVSLVADAAGYLTMDPSEAAAAAFRGRTWVDDGIDFALGVYQPTVNDLGPDGLVHQVVGLFEPNMAQRENSAKWLALRGPLPREVWDRVASDAARADLLFWVPRTDIPSDVRSTLIIEVRVGIVGLEVVAALATVDDVEAKIAGGIDRDGELLLTFCRGDVAAAFIGEDRPVMARIAAAKNTLLPDWATKRLAEDPRSDVVEALLKAHPGVRLSRRQWQVLVETGSGVGRDVLSRCTRLPWLMRRRLMRQPWST